MAVIKRKQRSCSAPTAGPAGTDSNRGRGPRRGAKGLPCGPAFCLPLQCGEVLCHSAGHVCYCRGWKTEERYVAAPKDGINMLKLPFQQPDCQERRSMISLTGREVRRKTAAICRIWTGDRGAAEGRVILHVCMYHMHPHTILEGFSGRCVCCV